MVFLEHLVGDIHQPLHASTRIHAGTSDIGGNSVKITLSSALKAKFTCAPSTYTPTELHAFWDDLPGSCPAATGLAPAAAYAAKVRAKAPAAGVADTDPADWANDSLALAEKNSYAAPIGPGLTVAGGTAGFTITQAYYTRSSAVAKKQIALAGARLAKVLNENLK